MNFVHALLFLGLFLNFFVRNYIMAPARRKPVQIAVQEDLAQSAEPKTEDITSGNERTHVEQLVTQMEEEADAHLALLHSCAEETCCHLKCRNSRPRIKNGKSRNYCIPNTINSFQRCNGFAVPESLKVRKSLKDL